MRKVQARLAAGLLLLGSGSVLAAPPHAKADTDGDGAVSKAEMADMRLRMFDRMDTDGDGLLTKAEMQAHHARMKKHREKVREKRETRHEARFGELDADGDGRVSRDEMAGAPFPFFDQADADGDGKLTRDEMKAMRAKHRGTAER